jgi:hypothetical protein
MSGIYVLVSFFKNISLFSDDEEDSAGRGGYN